MQYCNNCILPDTRPNLTLDNAGICNACNSYLKRPEIDWKSRQRELETIIQETLKLGKDYDCLIPVSGGKDSTWQTIKCLEMGLKPLALTWRPPGRTLIGQKNLDNLISLGVDHIDFTVNPKIEKHLTLRAFKEYGASAIPMHLAIFSIPLRIAMQMSIPLIIYGENSATEYGGHKSDIGNSELDGRWIKTYGVTQGTTALDWIDGVVNSRDLAAYNAPDQKQLKQLGIRSIFLGHFLEWDPRTTRDVAIANGFTVSETGPLTGYYNFADIDDDFISIHHWMKWYKFGFTRAFDNLSLDIRKGMVTREKALNIIQKLGDQTPNISIDRFCEFIEIEENMLNQIIENFRNPDIWKKNKSGVWEIPNFIIADWDWK